MKKLLNPKLIAVLSLLLLSTIALGAWAQSRSQSKQNVLRDLEVFAKVIERLESFYVEDIDTHELVTNAIVNMLQELDPHSQYLSGLDYEDLMLSTQGQFGGLGIYISFRDNYPTVISPIDETPAARAGLQGGDQIVEIEGEPSKGWQVQKAVRYLRGEPGSAVRFKINRPGLAEPIEYSLVREKITVSSVSYSGMFGDDIGYVKLSSFSKNSRRELETALNELEDQGMKGLVLDLRWNPGGLLQAATSISELFLDKDKLVVYTKGRYSENNHKYYAGRGGKHNDYPIVVMINGATASASEIVAGALQDWDAGFVVGQTSFGKGTVQTVFSLSDSQAVKLTTAKYYTPSGRCIHSDHKRQEASMDDDVEGDDEIAMSQSVDEDPEIADKPIFYTSGGRAVYGGGGITPDLEFDVRSYGEFPRRLERDGMFFTFAVDYSTDHKIKKDFVVDDEVIDAFKALLTEREFEYKDADFEDEENLEYIRKGITREVVSKNFGKDEMYRVMLGYDEDFREVLTLFDRTQTLADMFKYAEEQRATKKASLE